MISLLPDFETLKERVLSVQGAVFIFGKLCLLAVFFFILSGYDFFFGNNSVELGDLKLEIAQATVTDRNILPLDHYKSMAKKDIFGIVKPPEAPVQKKTPPLNLKLIGTHLKEDNLSIAIVEETKKRKQDVFRVGSKIFNTAELLEISSSTIKISYNGKEEILELKAGASIASDSKKSGKAEGTTEFVIKEAELNAALNNLPVLLSQARAVPYFRNGKSIGMRLFAIRRGSLYEKLGLKNGDILKSINDNSLSDPSQAIKLFEELKSERAIYTTVERAGRDTDLRYTIE